MFVSKVTNDTTTIVRHSQNSTLTMDWAFEDEDSSAPSPDLPNCGCGWPQHLLLPRGTPEGMVFDVFVIVTDGELDKPAEELAEVEEDVCLSSHILCGKWGRRYPDARPMGYPFDRKPYSISNGEGGTRPVSNLEEYVQELPNIKVTQVRNSILNYANLC
jgi:tyrosinase